jgi:hypothetical protein
VLGKLDVLSRKRKVNLDKLIVSLSIIDLIPVIAAARCAFPVALVVQR